MAYPARWKKKAEDKRASTISVKATASQKKQIEAAVRLIPGATLSSFCLLAAMEKLERINGARSGNGY